MNEEFESKLERMICDLRRTSGNDRLCVVLHSDLSGHTKDALTGIKFESFNNFIDFHGEKTDPQYKLRKRLRQLEKEIAGVRRQLYGNSDEDDIPF